MRFGNHAQEGNAQHVFDVFHRKHFAAFYTFGVVAGNQQVFFHLFAFFGMAALALQDAQDAVGVAHAGHFGIGGNDGFVGKIQRHQRTGFDTGGRIANHEFEVQFFGKLGEYAFHAFAGECVFIAGLRGGQYEQVVAMLVFNQCLVQCGFVLDNVD